MNKHELHVLRARLWEAKMHNFQIGAAQGLADELEALGGAVKTAAHRGSPDHLIALVDQAIEGKPVGHPEVKPKAEKPAAPKAEPKVEAKPEPKKESPKPAPAPKVEAKVDAKTASGVLPEMPSEKPEDDDLMNF